VASVCTVEDATQVEGTEDRPIVDSAPEVDELDSAREIEQSDSAPEVDERDAVADSGGETPQLSGTVSSCAPLSVQSSDYSMVGFLTGYSHQTSNRRYQLVGGF